MGLLARELGVEKDLARLIDLNGTVKTKLMQAALLSKEISTLKSYFCHFGKWKHFALENGFKVIPADKEIFSLFLVENVSLSYGSLKICVAAVSFFHKVFNFPCPVGSNSMINGYVEKFSRKPKVVRNPLLVEHMEAVFNYFDFEKCSLYHLRTIGFMVLGFFGFLRFSDFVNLRVCDLIFDQAKLVIKISKSKTDKGGFGQQVVFDLSSFPAKFVDIFFRRFRLFEYSRDFYLFMAMRKHGKDKLMLFRDTKCSYNAASTAFKTVLGLVGVSDPTLKLHSLRIGGATEASRLGVPDFKISRNGRWKSDSSRTLYQRDPGIGVDSISMVLSREF